ncbi:hypothetical protein B7P43_G02779 [Cryptotermes secundus]|uniref:Mos1 transposase HTH domain-containing protein n=1 Tax=Cryptotermes secundus TaxID=105785 RepID=A0A2J7RSS2_9NEOP|nr:hypothetical protein B7P43_G02779 [Cryptotermes secundus]
MDAKIEQRVCIKFCVKLGKPATETLEILREDNAPAHTSLKTTYFVTNNNMFIVPHCPYSPNLFPCDFALFPKLKM